MRDKVVKVCLSLVLACTLVVSPFVKAEKAYAVVPAVAAAASAWGVSEGAVVAAVSAMAAACGVALVGQTETGIAWPDYVNSPDDLFALWETQDILESAAEQNGGGYEPKNNNGGGNFLECVKQLATVGAITGVGSAVNAGVNFLLDKLLPNPEVSSSVSPVFINTLSYAGIDIPFGSLPSYISWDDTTSWYGCYVYDPPVKKWVNGVQTLVSAQVATTDKARIFFNGSGWESDDHPTCSYKHTYWYYLGGDYIGSSDKATLFELGPFTNGYGFVNPKFFGTYYVEYPANTDVATITAGVPSGGLSNTTKLDANYEIANIPPELLASLNASAASANDAANRAQAVADATQAILDDLASTGSSVQTTPSTSNDRDDYVTPNPTVEPVEPTEPVDPDAPFDWNQFLQPDLYLVFPFCLPWDIYELVSLLSSSAEAPVFDLPFKVPVEGGDYTVHIDLSVFDPVAEVARAMELLAVAAGLIFLTKKMIEN